MLQITIFKTDFFLQGLHMFMLLNYGKLLATLLNCTKYHGMDGYRFDVFHKKGKLNLKQFLGKGNEGGKKGFLTQHIRKASLNLALFQSYQEPCLGLDLI